MPIANRIAPQNPSTIGRAYALLISAEHIEVCVPAPTTIRKFSPGLTEKPWRMVTEKGAPEDVPADFAETCVPPN